MKPSRISTFVVALALTLTACGNATKSASTGASNATSATNPIIALTSLNQFAAAFDADKGAPRLILLAAPT